MALLTRLAIALLLLAGLSAPVLAREEIVSFVSDVVVRPDGVLDVTERITVNAEALEIRRGIYRDFPLTFVDDTGGVHRVSFDIISVKRDGRPEPYHTNQNAEGIRIYMGDADTYLSPGRYTYELRYTTGRQIRFFSDHTELFWNVTGNDWSFPILAVTARFALPDDKAPVRWTAYTGRYGLRGDAYQGQVHGDNVLEVTTTETLAPLEGLSVAIEIPEGLVAPPTGSQAFGYWLSDNKRVVIALVGFLGVLLFYLVTWNAVGRDPPKGTIIPLYYPPEGISPALAGYIDNWGWSEGGWRNFTAATVSLATKGLIVFDDSGKDIVLTQTKTPEPTGAERLPPGEQVIYDWVKRRDGRLVINKANGPSLNTTFTSFKSRIETENRDKFFKRNIGFFIIGLMLTAVAVIAVVMFGGLDQSEFLILVFCGVIGFILGVFIVPILRVIFFGRPGKTIILLALQLAIAGYVLFGFVSVFFAGQTALPSDFGRSGLWSFVNNSFPFLLVAGFALLNGLFLYLLRAPTAAGRKVMDQIDGLELYIRTAETERMNLAGAPDLTTQHFERLLPYAIALSAERPWSEAFQAAFARANPGEAFASGYQPGWHAGRGWHGSSFGSSMASAVSAAAGSFQSSVPAPKSSSSGFSGGGGGGSGGGGGGGGGGGW